jgi:ornithine decarboxylase
VAEIASASGVKVDVIDVGGGFPVAYDGMTPPPLADYFAEIKEAIIEHSLEDLELLAEPGRALVGRGMSLIARVELRKDHADGLHTLHLNDGTYGGLQEGAKWQGIRYPVRQAGRKRDDVNEMLGFRLAGPTCDSLDMMPGPYMLPADIAEGDWIEVEQHGAYGLCTRTTFNGFTKFDKVFLKS